MTTSRDATGSPKEPRSARNELLRRRKAIALLGAGLFFSASCKPNSQTKRTLLTDAERRDRGLAEPAFVPRNSPIKINTTDLDSAIEWGLKALEKNLNPEQGYAPYFEIYGHSFKTTRALTGQHVDPERTEPPERHHNWSLTSNVAGKGLYALVIGMRALAKDPTQSENVRGLAQLVTRMMLRPRPNSTTRTTAPLGKEGWEIVPVPGNRASIDSNDFSLYYLSTAGAGYRGMLGLNLLAKDSKQPNPIYGYSPRELFDACIDDLLDFYVYGPDGAKLHDWERFRREFKLEGGSSTIEVERSWSGAYQNNIQPLMLDALIEYSEHFPGARTEELIQDLKTYGLHDMYPADWADKRQHEHMYEVVAGIAAFARLAVRDRDQALLARMQAYFEGLFTMGAALPSGWVAERLYGVQRQWGKPGERLNSDTGEINCSVQLIETAMRFGDQGLGGKYYQYAERALRAHVLPAQLRDVDQLVGSPDGTEEGHRVYSDFVRGAFGFPAPYGVIPMKNAYFVTAYFMDITAGAVASLARVRERAHQVRVGSLYIPLLFDLQTSSASVQSPYTQDGAVTITPHQSFEKIYLRRPDWLPPDEVRLITTGSASGKKSKSRIAFEVAEDWIVFATKGSRETIRIRFPLVTSVSYETLNDRKLTIHWRGDSVASMSGIEAPLRFFPTAK